MEYTFLLLLFFFVSLESESKIEKYLKLEVRSSAQNEFKYYNYLSCSSNLLFVCVW